MGVESLLKKLCQWLCGIAIVCSSVASHAYWDGNNALVGLSAGYARHTGRLDVGVTYAIPNLQADSFANGHGDILNTGFFVGYRRICQSWLLDGELHVDFYGSEPDFFFNFTALFNDVIYHATRHYRHGPGYGITARWGYAMSPNFIAYMVFGLETNKEKLDISVQGNDPFFNQSVLVHDTRQQLRGLVGFGAELPICFICQNLSLRLEYRYYSLDKVLNPMGTLISAPTSPVPLDPALSFALRPKFNTFRVQLLWNFL